MWQEDCLQDIEDAAATELAVNRSKSRRDSLQQQLQRESRALEAKAIELEGHHHLPHSLRALGEVKGHSMTHPSHSLSRHRRPYDLEPGLPLVTAAVLSSPNVSWQDDLNDLETRIWFRIWLSFLYRWYSNCIILCWELLILYSIVLDANYHERAV